MTHSDDTWKVAIKSSKWHLLHVDAIKGGSQLNNWQFNSIIEVKLALTNAADNSPGIFRNCNKVEALTS